MGVGRGVWRVPGLVLAGEEAQGVGIPRRVDIRLPGKGNSNSHGARPVRLIITMI